MNRAGFQTTQHGGQLDDGPEAQIDCCVRGAGTEDKQKQNPGSTERCCHLSVNDGMNRGIIMVSGLLI